MEGQGNKGDIVKPFIFAVSHKTVTPVKTGIQEIQQVLDSRLRGSDKKGVFSTFYETINVDISHFSYASCTYLSTISFRYSLFNFSQAAP
jgi:hypothetical protein